MVKTGDPEKTVQEADSKISEWRQGDCVLGVDYFLHRFNPELPITKESEESSGGDNYLVETEVPGFVVISQSCDIVKPCSDWPFVEIAPLVEVSPEMLNEIKRCYRPRYAFIPGVEENNLVADLDRIMTFEKPVFALCERIPGCRTDQEKRAFAQALVRKRARSAFPNDFGEFCRELRERLIEKHDRQSDEGKALRGLREIRVRAAPSWSAREIELTFWFISKNESQPEYETPEDLIQKWQELVPKSGRFTNVICLLVTMEDLTAKEYIESDPLDLDHLSSR